MSKRKFTKAEKKKILKEAKANGVKVTFEKYGVYPSTFYSWKKKMELMCEKGLSHGMTPAHLKEIRRLEKENQDASIQRNTEFPPIFCKSITISHHKHPFLHS